MKILISVRCTLGNGKIVGENCGKMEFLISVNCEVAIKIGLRLRLHEQCLSNINRLIVLKPLAKF